MATIMRFRGRPLSAPFRGRGSLCVPAISRTVTLRGADGSGP